MPLIAQPPQLLLSSRKFMQKVGAATGHPFGEPAEQVSTQLPPEHIWPARHAPQVAPQWLKSFEVSVQTPPQLVRPVEHLHEPPWQVWPAPLHRTLQPPQ